ncbi:D-alanine--D-alanine ligase [bioreactor metagenome]|uniref:D-alanine--D-alanine ligase n=1 Tax=bioreactor metagenome TaxID=1076179 RepID=A0A645AI33_9ZZZZ
MENQSEEVPLGPIQVGVVYNLKHAEQSRSAAPDDQAEYDSMDTVLAIEQALQRQGCRTILLEADEELPEKLRRNRPDFVFNIAEGRGGRAREAQVPALLSLFDIPYTGSDETTLCIALDKALTKRLLATYRIPTPRYRVYEPGARIRTAGLRFPVIVKPNAEGSSKGIADVCIAENAAELKSLVEQNLSLYGGSVLVEEYIHGREFTVGLLGNGERVTVFPPMEILYHDSPIAGYHVYNYTVKQEYTKYVSYRCPAELSSKLEREITELSKKIFLALGCRDFARVDFRLDESGKLYFIEINPLPGLAPHYSDYPMLAEFCGMEYDDLVGSVFRAGAARSGVCL